MNKWWRKYADKFDRLSLRERAMVFAATALVVVFVIYATAIDPPQQRRQQLASQMHSQREETATLQAQRDKLAGAMPDADGAGRRDAVARRIEESDERLRALHKSLVPAQRMNLLLQEMLRADPGLQLVSLRTIAAVPLLPDTAKSAPPATPPPGGSSKRAFVEANVYKHGVEITLRGGYEQLYNYLARLERSEWRMLWSRARLTADEHPRLTLTLTIYTLSLDKAWLEV